MDPYIKKKIIRKQGTAFEDIEDYIAVEKKHRVFVNEKEVISLYCTPLMLKELVTGLFLTEGILTEKPLPDEIKITYGDEIRVDIFVAGNLLTEGIPTSRCLAGITFDKKRHFEKVQDNFSIPCEAIKSIFNEFQQKSEFFKLTGCFHSAALSDDKKILAFAEDIGRHNAVDKVIGYCILENIPFIEKMMVVSCRLSSEIVSKCSRWGIPIVVSRAAATDLAIDIAEKSGITLIGFARGDRMNVYTNAQRIIS